MPQYHISKTMPQKDIQDTYLDYTAAINSFPSKYRSRCDIDLSMDTQLICMLPMYSCVTVWRRKVEADYCKYGLTVKLLIGISIHPFTLMRN